MNYRQWDRVLVHALLGLDDETLGERPDVDVDAVAHLIRPRLDEVAAVRRARADRGESWPVPPSATLAEGLAWGQYATAVRVLLAQLGLDASGSGRVSRADAPPADAETRRLNEDRPPHW